MLFSGHAELTIDGKGRLSVPAKYRNQWDPTRDGAAWMCIPWPGTGLRLYTEASFNRLSAEGFGEDRLLPGEDEGELEADLFGLAERIEMDSAGRISLPKLHMELTGLSTDVVVLGARNRLEVRDRAVWAASLKDRFTRLPELVKRIEASKNGSPKDQ